MRTQSEMGGVMFRHLMAILIMVVGVVLGAIFALISSWQTGAVVAVVICGVAFIFAIINMAIAVRRDF